ncbi:hypothetical protein JXJ21_00190 [candidate division KSB1 bacterium]|nr:hypothetical protein [candidate division KSB1 bacterium]
MTKACWFTICFLAYFSSAMAFQRADIMKLRSDYSDNKKQIAIKQGELKARYLQYTNENDRNELLDASAQYVFENLTENIFPAWYGTEWDFNGNTRVPGEGGIACGSFVVFTLQDVGFKIPSGMYRQPSENIIKNLTTSSNIKRFPNHAPMDKIINWIHQKGEGLYIVGLDIHVGFIIFKNGRITFCHSSYYEPPLKVVNQAVTAESPLTDSNYRVLGKILTKEMMKKWLSGEEFEVIHDYFRR